MPCRPLSRDAMVGTSQPSALSPQLSARELTGSRTVLRNLCRIGRAAVKLVAMRRLLGILAALIAAQLLQTRRPRAVRGAAPARRPSPVVHRVPRRHPDRSPVARHPPRDPRRGARPHRRAERRRHRTRPYAGGNRSVPRPVRRAARDVEDGRDRPGHARPPPRAPGADQRPLRRRPVAHRQHLGLRVELRAVQRRTADDHRARHARLGPAPLGVVPGASCSTPSTS